MPKHDKRQIPLREMYQYYKNSTGSPVSYKDYKLILDTWGEELTDYVSQGKDVHLYHGMAVFGVRKRRIKTFVDKLASRIQKKRVVAVNTHSDFFAARMRWGMKATTFNRRGWNFRSSRFLKKKIATIMLMPGGHRTYMEEVKVAYSEKAGKRLYKKQVLKL